MFERFTYRARRIVVLAQEEARLLEHSKIGTEHFLLAILKEGENRGAQHLASTGIEYDAIRQVVNEMHASEIPHTMVGHLPFDPQAKKVMEVSLQQSMQLGHNYIGEEHLFLALMKGHDYSSGEVLTKVGSDPRSLYEEMHAIVTRASVTVYQVNDNDSPYPFKYMEDAYELMKRAEQIARGGPITRAHIEQALSGF